MGTLFIRPPVVAGALSLFVLGLCLTSLAAQLIRIRMGDQAPERLIRAFNVDAEWNVPTWYSSMSLLVAAGLLALCAAAARRQRTGYVGHWWALSCIFVLLSLDELARLHEDLRWSQVAALLPEVFAQSWLSVGIPVAAILAFVFLPFLIGLPRRTALLFVAAGTFHVILGALGTEAVAWLMGYHTDFASRNVTYALLATGEELAEMIGVVLFIYAILDYLASAVPDLRLGFGEPKREA